MTTDRWYHADLTNWLPLDRGDIVCCDGWLVVEPDRRARVRPGSVTAKLRFSAEALAGTPSDNSPGTIVPVVCDLLSFASRRAVSFRTDEDWWPPEHRHLARGPNRRRGRVESVAETQLLLDRALPTLLDPTMEWPTKLGTALRWFLSSRMQHGISMRYVALWIVLEMTARA
jgi:hypothetical protein